MKLKLGYAAAVLGSIGLAAGPLDAAIARPASPAAAAASEAEASNLDPDAIAALERMSAYLRSLISFEMNAVTSIDEEIADQLITYDGTTTYKVRAPNAFFINMKTDRKVRDVYYDGRQLTIYAPRQKLYTRLAAPKTIRETLQMAEDKYGVTLPLVDLFRWGTEKARINDLITAVYIGPATCGAVLCDHFAFQQENLDWQIWIENGARPVPRKLVITTLLDTSQPRFSAQLDWTVNPPLDDAVFAFTPPPESHAIPIVAPKD